MSVYGGNCNEFNPQTTAFCCSRIEKSNHNRCSIENKSQAMLILFCTFSLVVSRVIERIFYPSAVISVFEFLVLEIHGSAMTEGQKKFTKDCLQCLEHLKCETLTKKICYSLACFFTKKKPKNELMSRPDMYFVVAGLVSIPLIIPDKDP